MSDRNTDFTVSFVIPVLNSAATLEDCLSSIRNQNYPQKLTEIIVADGGSTDNTLAIAEKYRVDKIVDNPLKTGEAGKSAGLKVASGTFLAMIDSDNILEDENWLAQMLTPFSTPDIIAVEPIRYTFRKNDPALTRYFALMGMNDPLCLFLGNYDRENAITGKWTALNISYKDTGSYLDLKLIPSALPTIGANGFVFRRELLKHVIWDPYFFDIDIVQQAVTKGYDRIAKVKCGIVHLYCSNLKDFAKKQNRRINDFLFFTEHSQRTYPWKTNRKTGIVKFCAATVLILPLLLQTLKGFSRKHDSAWIYHIPACWVTLWIYTKATLRKALGIKPPEPIRKNWQTP